AGALAFTTAVRMVDRVHGNTAVGRADAEPAVASCLADRDVLVVGVGQLADRGAAAGVKKADFAAGHLHLAVFAFLRHELGVVAGGTSELAALARLHFDVVDQGTDRDLADLEVVARLDVGRVAG